MNDSRRLLAEYANQGSEQAFREIVERYLNLVYSAALRMADGDSHLAEDIAQMVFADLARKASTLSHSVMLGGWLHRHTCFVAATIRRSERRRRSRERQAMEMSAHHSESNFATVMPILDDAINRLGEEDRRAILLRFFEQQDFRSVGAVLGSNEDAARMRVNRALEKLQIFLKRRGVALSAVTLGTLLAGEVVQAAPAGLAASISSAALTGAAGSTGITLTLVKAMATTKLKIGIITALVAAGVTAPLVIEHHSTARLREKDEALRLQQTQLTQLAAENERLTRALGRARSATMPRLPAPPLRAGAALVDSSEDLTQTNLISRVLKGEWPKLTAEQINAYLTANRRDAGSLLAVFRATDDKAFLKEAEEKYPNDPRVAYAAVFKSDSPEERRQWLDQFKQSAPDNAMATYLSALDYFKSGQTDQAVQDLMTTSGKTQFQDYSWDFVQNAEEAWRAAGYSEAETRMVATWQLMLPQLAELKGLNENIMNLANSYQQAGDAASAQAMLQMNLNLGQRLDSSATTPLISQLVGITIEQNALGTMDPASAYGDSGQTVKDYLDQLTQQRATIHELVKQIEPLQQTMTPQDWINYNDRTRSFGEVNAIHWLLTKYGQN
jgi:RNA polymerase sigma factor (sigma-70 family)